MGLEQPNPQPNNSPHIADLVCDDVRQRKAKGVETYGTALQPFNGRSALQDLYEELLDASVYIKQEMEERKHIHHLLTQLRASLDNQDVSQGAIDLLSELIHITGDNCTPYSDV